MTRSAVTGYLTSGSGFSAHWVHSAVLVPIGSNFSNRCPLGHSNSYIGIVFHLHCSPAPRGFSRGSSKCQAFSKRQIGTLGTSDGVSASDWDVLFVLTVSTNENHFVTCMIVKLSPCFITIMSPSVIVASFCFKSCSTAAGFSRPRAPLGIGMSGCPPPQCVMVAVK